MSTAVKQGCAPVGTSAVFEVCAFKLHPCLASAKLCQCVVTALVGAFVGPLCPIHAVPPTPPPGGEEDIQNSLLEKAQAAGGFAAPAAALSLEELGVGTPAGWLHRGLLLQVRVSVFGRGC